MLAEAVYGWIRVHLLLLETVQSYLCLLMPGSTTYSKRVDDSSPLLPTLRKFIDILIPYWLHMTEDEYIENLLWRMSLASLIYYAYNMKITESQMI